MVRGYFFLAGISLAMVIWLLYQERYDTIFHWLLIASLAFQVAQNHHAKTTNR